MKLPFLTALAMVSGAGIAVHADEWPTTRQQAIDTSLERRIENALMDLEVFNARALKVDAQAKNLIIAIVSVILSLDQNFSFLAGFAFVFGCLSLNQIAYVIGAAIIVFSEDPKASLTGDQADDYPGESYPSHDAKGLSKHAPLARRADHKSG